MANGIPLSEQWAKSPTCGTWVLSSQLLVTCTYNRFKADCVRVEEEFLRKKV